MIDHKPLINSINQLINSGKTLGIAVIGCDQLQRGTLPV